MQRKVMTNGGRTETFEDAYFRIERGSLLRFHKRTSKRVRNSYPLSLCTLTSKVSDVAFAITPMNKSTITLYATNKKQRRQWEKVIEKYTCGNNETRQLHHQKDQVTVFAESCIDESDACFVVDLTGTIKSASQKLYEICEHEPASLIDRNISVLVPKKHARRHDAYIQRYLDGETKAMVGKPRKLSMRKRDNTEIAVVLFLCEVRDMCGALFFKGVLTLDDPVRSELDLHLFPNAAAISDDYGVILDVNAKLCALFGYTRQELIDENVTVFMPQAMRARHPGYLKRYRTGGGGRLIGKPREVIAARKDGTLFCCEILLGEFRAGGKTTILANMRAMERVVTEEHLGNIEEKDDCDLSESDSEENSSEQYTASAASFGTYTATSLSGGGGSGGDMEATRRSLGALPVEYKHFMTKVNRAIATEIMHLHERQEKRAKKVLATSPFSEKVSSARSRSVPTFVSSYPTAASPMRTSSVMSEDGSDIGDELSASSSPCLSRTTSAAPERAKPKSRVIQLRAENMVICKRISNGGGSGCEIYAVNIEGWRCAMKELDMSNTNQATIETFVKEIYMVEALPYNENICRYLFHEIVGDRLRLFMTLYDGSLSDYIMKAQKEQRVFNFYQVVEFLRQILNGVSFLHTRGIMHRDLKSDNVFVTKGDRDEVRTLALGDFDQAKFGTPMTIVGTPGYIAPEVFNGEEYSFPADIWSFGMIVYELVAQARPFQGVSPLQFATRIKDGAPPFPQDVDLSLKKFELIYEMCTVLNPDKRASVTDLKKALATLK